MMVRIIFEGKPEDIGELINTLPNKLFNNTFKSQVAVATEASPTTGIIAKVGMQTLQNCYEAIQELKKINVSNLTPIGRWDTIEENEIIQKALQEVNHE